MELSRRGFYAVGCSEWLYALLRSIVTCRVENNRFLLNHEGLGLQLHARADCLTFYGTVNLYLGLFCGIFPLT
jgi:hypothetical protein